MKNHLIRQAVEAFLLDREARQLSQNSLDFYRWQLTPFCRWLEGQKVTLEALQAAHLRRYFAAWGQTHSRGGVHAAWRAISVFLRWAGREYDLDHLSHLLLHVGEPKLPKTPLPPVEPETIRALLATCGQDYNGVRDRAIILVLYDSGLRARELLSLNVADVNLRDGRVFVTCGKGAKSRTTYIGPSTRRAVRRYLNTRRRLTPDAPLWVSTTAQRLSYAGLRSMLRRRCAQAGVALVTPHAFRRAWAVNMLRNGASIYHLRDLGGWADLDALKPYLKLAEQDLATAHRTASPVEHLYQ